MKKLIKNKIYTACLVLIFTLAQVFAGIGTIAKAAGNDFVVTVQVESFEKVITIGQSDKANGFEALKQVLDKNNISMVATDGQWGKFISEINGVKAAQFGGYDGWLYAINRVNKYVDITAGIDGTTLENGDKLILYYGDMGTLAANEIVYSTNEPNKELIIDLNNSYKDWTTGKPVIQPINGIKAKIDGKEVIVVNNKIAIKDGLESGKHSLQLSDFKQAGCPKVVYDELEFTLGEATSGGNNENDGATDVDNTQISKTIDESIKNAATTVKTKGINTWSAMSLNKLGEKIDPSFLKESIEEIKQNGVVDLSNTDLEKLIMGLTASGYTPYNVEGYNLISELFNRDIDTFLINDAVFGIFVYNYANIKEDYKITKEKLADIILKSKLSYEVDGNKIVGWTYYGDKVDPDMTGAAINALSEFYDVKPEVKEAIDAAVKTISILQNESGYSISQYGIASETTSFVILGLTSVGINPEGEMFTKGKGDLVSALLSFKAEDGGFKHVLEDSKSNYTSTEESLRALIAIEEYKNSGKYDFYSSNINAKALPVFVLGNITNNEGTKVLKDNNIDKLPETGALVDSNVLIILGLAFIVIGVLNIKKFKSENK